TLRFVRPGAPQIAEFWSADQSWVLKATRDGGAGFDAVWSDGLREAVRAALGEAARGRDAAMDLDRVARALGRPAGFDASWRAVQHLENHDIVYAGHEDRKPRIPALGDPTNARSWYARSPARVALGPLAQAAGIPMRFMGQEFLEDKPWNDTPDPATLIYWEGLEADEVMRDYLRFSQDLVRLRRSFASLRGEACRVFHVHNGN